MEKIKNKKISVKVQLLSINHIAHLSLNYTDNEKTKLIEEKVKPGFIVILSLVFSSFFFFFLGGWPTPPPPPHSSIDKVNTKEV